MRSSATFASERRPALAASGLTALSAHAMMVETGEVERTLEAAAALGVKTLIDPAIRDAWGTAEGVAGANFPYITLEGDWVAPQAQEVAKALKAGGHKVSLLLVPDDLKAVTSGLARRKPDLVFHMIHDFGGESGLIATAAIIDALPPFKRVIG